MKQAIVVFNSGSTSLKFGAYAMDPAAIVARLGGGASLCAMLDGRSVETTMGFSDLSGLPMPTRLGDVPPGALFYLLRRELFDDATLETMLYERSGLLGLTYRLSALAIAPPRRRAGRGRPLPSNGRRYARKAGVMSLSDDAMNESAITLVLPATSASFTRA